MVLGAALLIRHSGDPVRVAVPHARQRPGLRDAAGGVSSGRWTGLQATMGRSPVADLSDAKEQGRVGLYEGNR